MSDVGTGILTTMIRSWGDLILKFGLGLNLGVAGGVFGKLSLGLNLEVSRRIFSMLMLGLNPKC